MFSVTVSVNIVGSEKAPSMSVTTQVILYTPANELASVIVDFTARVYKDVEKAPENSR